MLHSNIQNQMLKLLFSFSSFFRIETSDICKHLPDQLIAMILTDQILLLT